MDLTRLFMRLAMWARRPPSRSQLRVILAVVVLALVCFGIERYFGWPDWLTLERTPRAVMPRQ